MTNDDLADEIATLVPPLKWNHGTTILDTVNAYLAEKRIVLGRNDKLKVIKKVASIWKEVWDLMHRLGLLDELKMVKHE